MEVSKERLLEIERELNSLTLLDIARLENLNIARTVLTPELRSEFSKKAGYASYKSGNNPIFTLSQEDMIKRNKKAALASTQSPNRIANKTFTCPHCSRMGKGPKFLSMHMDKCPIKDINKEQFHNDIHTMTIVGVKKKYNLPNVDVVRFYKRDILGI